MHKLDKIFLVIVVMLLINTILFLILIYLLYTKEAILVEFYKETKSISDQMVKLVEILMKLHSSGRQ